MAQNQIPSPPPGYTLDRPQSATPPPPPGYTLDGQQEATAPGQQDRPAPGFAESLMRSVGIPVPSWDMVKHAAADTAREVGSGFIKTALQPISNALSPAINKIPVIGPKLVPNEGVIQFKNATETHGDAENFGGTLERTGEMALMGGPLESGSEALATKLLPFAGRFGRRLLPTAIRVGTEALNTGGNAALHGENPGIPALTGAAAAGTSEALPALISPLRNSAGRLYSKVLAPTKEADKFLTDRIVPGLMDRRVTALTQSGLLNKAARNANQLGSQINSMTDDLIDSANTPNFNRRALPPPSVEIPTGVQEIRPFDSPGKVIDAESRPVIARPGSGPRPVNVPKMDGLDRQFLSGSEHPELSGELTNPGVLITRDPNAIRSTASRLNTVVNDAEHMGTLPPSEQSAIREQAGSLRAAANPNAKPMQYPVAQTQPLIDRLERYKQGFMVNAKPVNHQAVQAVNDLQDMVREHGDLISYGSLRKMRQILDKQVEKSGAFVGKTLAEGSQMDAKAELANAIRGELAKASPDIAKVNAEFNFWSNLQRVMQDTMKRKTGQIGDTLPKVQAAAIAGGSLARTGLRGSAAMGAAFYALGKVMRSAGWRTASASSKARLADAIASGNAGAVTKLIGRFGAASEGNRNRSDVGDQP